MNPLNLICHRKPERTLQIHGHYLPVCARCTGFYTSAITYTLLAMIIPFQYTIQTTILAITLLIPATIDGTTQYLEKRESTNTIRLITGLLGGLGLIIIFKTIKLRFIY